MNILIVDDREQIVDLLREFLEQKGHAVNTAFDGKTALDLIKGKSIDIAIMDEDMPELSGLEIAKYIKQNNLTVKSIILTGYPHLDENFSKLIGADEYLAKPVDLEKIEEMVNKYKT